MNTHMCRPDKELLSLGATRGEYFLQAWTQAERGFAFAVLSFEMQPR